jgi:hypothetical protein
MKTYAVKWREPDGQTYLGRLALSPTAIQLDGRASDGPSIERQLGYDDVRALRLGHGQERLDGLPSLVLERANGTYQITSAVMQAGVLQELIDRLAQLRSLAPRRATIVVPLKEGVVERVRELAGHGPPFDPDATPLTRHQLLVTDHEAIFFFEAASDVALEALLGQLDFSVLAAAWRDLVAGPPRLAELLYVWERPELHLAKIGLGF